MRWEKVLVGMLGACAPTTETVEPPAPSSGDDLLHAPPCPLDDPAAEVHPGRSDEVVLRVGGDVYTCDSRARVTGVVLHDSTGTTTRRYADDGGLRWEETPRGARWWDDEGRLRDEVVFATGARAQRAWAADGTLLLEITELGGGRHQLVLSDGGATSTLTFDQGDDDWPFHRPVPMWEKPAIDAAAVHRKAVQRCEAIHTAVAGTNDSVKRVEHHGLRCHGSLSSGGWEGRYDEDGHRHGRWRRPIGPGHWIDVWDHGRKLYEAKAGPTTSYQPGEDVPVRVWERTAWGWDGPDRVRHVVTLDGDGRVKQLEGPPPPASTPTPPAHGPPLVDAVWTERTRDGWTYRCDDAPHAGPTCDVLDDAGRRLMRFVRDTDSGAGRDTWRHTSPDAQLWQPETGLLYDGPMPYQQAAGRVRETEGVGRLAEGAYVAASDSERWKRPGRRDGRWTVREDGRVVETQDWADHHLVRWRITDEDGVHEVRPHLRWSSDRRPGQTYGPADSVWRDTREVVEVLRQAEPEDVLPAWCGGGPSIAPEHAPWVRHVDEMLGLSGAPEGPHDHPVRHRLVREVAAADVVKMVRADPRPPTPAVLRCLWEASEEAALQRRDHRSLASQRMPWPDPFPPDLQRELAPFPQAVANGLEQAAFVRANRPPARPSTRPPPWR